GAIKSYVAKMDDVADDMIFQYLIVRSTNEASVYAPIDYGGSPGWLLRDSTDKKLQSDGGYWLPNSFLTDYLWPQTAYKEWPVLDKWSVFAQCNEIFIKDDDGKYW